MGFAKILESILYSNHDGLEFKLLQSVYMEVICYELNKLNVSMYE